MKKCISKLMGLGLGALLATGVSLPVFAETDSNDVPQIHVDQVGYLPDYQKVAIVAGATQSNEFKVINADTQQIVYKGAFSGPRQDICSGDTVRNADFTAVTTPGTYIVSVDGLGNSYKFKIANNVYYKSLVQTLRSFTLGRCNNGFSDPITGLSIDSAAHQKYKTAKVYFSDGISTKGDVIDVSGGWYDAGDFGKYIPTASISVANILLAYENHPERFTQGQMLFPEGIPTDSKLPDVLSEMKYELDWMLKMQRSDGAVYVKAAGKFWPSLEVSPEQDTGTRYIYGLSTYNTAMYGAANAMAARIYQQYDPEYAATLLAAAKKAYAYLAAHPESSFRLDENQDSGSGPYNKDTENETKLWLESIKQTNPKLKMSADAEERIWLAAELFKTTGDQQYEKYLQTNFKNVLTLKSKGFAWMNGLALGQWAYVTNSKANSAVKAQVKKALLAYADDTVKVIAADGYACSLKQNEYTWSSNRVAIAKANMLALAYQLDPKKEYLNGALDQIHYILGRNANSKSYLTGSGTNMPRYVHNRIDLSKGVYVPGHLVNGPNNWPGGDPVQAKCLAEGKVPTAKIYFDVRDSYSTNEYAIDYCAPVVYILSYFSNTNEILTPEDIKVPAIK